MAEQFNVVKFKGVEPEAFWILSLDLAFQRGKPFLRTSDRLTEDQLRKTLKTMGASDSEIESLIQNARSNAR